MDRPGQQDKFKQRTKGDRRGNRLKMATGLSPLGLNRMFSFSSETILPALCPGPRTGISYPSDFPSPILSSRNRLLAAAN
jgi:hypothetical protein